MMATEGTTKRAGRAEAAAPARAGGSVAPEPGTKANRLLRLTVVAERLGCSKKVAWRLYRAGAFPGAVLLLGSLRIPEAEVLRVASRGWPGERRGTPGNGN